MPDWWSEDPELAGYLKAYQQFKQDFYFKPTLIETPVYSDIYRYACTPDRYGQIETSKGSWNATAATVEIKATATIGCHVALQLAAQNLMCDDYEERAMLAVQLKPNGKYTPHNFSKEIKQHTIVFLSCLTLTMWRDRFHKTNLYT
jgi:hypothetical protein